MEQIGGRFNMIIYKITNKINGKIYIGLTSNLNKRILCYRSFTKRKKDNGQKILQAMIKHGFKNFEFEILEKVQTKDELRKKERQYINKFNSTNWKIGYNTDLGGFCPSDETLQKMSDSHIGQIAWNKGKKWTEEIKKKISLSKMGTITEHNKKISKSIVDQYGTIYKSRTEASKILKIQSSNIRKVLNGERKHTGGYTFTYLQAIS
jgi:group I intron endonuclease